MQDLFGGPWFDFDYVVCGAFFCRGHVLPIGGSLGDGLRNLILSKW